jgi:hypothetical protein
MGDSGPSKAAWSVGLTNQVVGRSWPIRRHVNGSGLKVRRLVRGKDQHRQMRGSRDAERKLDECDAERRRAASYGRQCLSVAPSSADGQRIRPSRSRAFSWSYSPAVASVPPRKCRGTGLTPLLIAIAIVVPRWVQGMRRSEDKLHARNTLLRFQPEVNWLCADVPDFLLV